MPYTEQDFEEMKCNPIAAHRYYWRVAMGAKRRALVAQREVLEMGERGDPRCFEEQYAADGDKRRMASLDEAVSRAILENIDAFVRTSIERPRVCPACKAQR